MWFFNIYEVLVAEIPFTGFQFFEDLSQFYICFIYLVLNVSVVFYFLIKMEILKCVDQSVNFTGIHGEFKIIELVEKVQLEDFVVADDAGFCEQLFSNTEQSMHQVLIFNTLSMHLILCLFRFHDLWFFISYVMICSIHLVVEIHHYFEIGVNLWVQNW